MARENGDAVEDPFGCGVRLSQRKLDRRRIEFFHFDRLSTDHKQIALRRMNLFVKIDLKSKHDIVCRERLPIGKAQALTKMQRVLPAVRGDVPGFREGWPRLQSVPVDMNQIAGEATNHVA